MQMLIAFAYLFWAAILALVAVKRTEKRYLRSEYLTLASFIILPLAGGIVQGMGMTLYEDVQYTEAGKMKNRNFMSYKIPTRLDMGSISVEFESSYEQTGPYGAKSIGEIVINTPAPAIADAVYNATGLRFRTLPITAEQVMMGLLEREEA